MTALAISNTSVADMRTGQTIPGQTVVVESGRITQLGPSDQIASLGDTVQIDGNGCTLVPGLADMHVHISPHAAGKDYDAAEAMRRAEQFLLVFLVSGVTTVRNMAGTPLHLALRDAVASGAAEGPTILSCGPVLETRFTFPELVEFGALVTTPQDARDAVKKQHQQGFDFIKVYNDIDADIYDAIFETAREIGIPVVGHVAFQKGLDGALAAKQNSIEHLRSYDFAADTRTDGEPPARYEGWLHTTPQRITELAERTAEAGVWNAPTMVVERGIRTDEELASGVGNDIPAFLPGWLKEGLAASAMEAIFTSQQRDDLAAGRGARAEMVSALSKAGAGLLAGSDCPGCSLVPGRSLLTELELLVEAGLSPWKALCTATIDAMRFLGRVGEGHIEVGQPANMILVKGNPFEDISALHQQEGVCVRGRYYPRAEIERRLTGPAAT